MPHTIQQAHLVNRASEILVTHRASLRRTAEQYAADLGTRYQPAYVLGQAHAIAAGVRATLDRLFAHRVEVLAAALAVGGATLQNDFTARYAALSDAVAVLEGSTEPTLPADLAAVQAALPAETML